MHLTCPVCKSELLLQGKTLCCEHNHSFDAARQGYWNLLLAYKKRSKDPGDNAAMVNARRQFLEKGFYQRLSDQVNNLALSALNGNTEPNILDMGCGEGYYSQRLAQALAEQNITANITGLDISKHAIKAACQRSKDIRWLVASGADIPIADNSLDLQLVLFSRLMPEAFAKPLKTQGALLLAWPAQNHLIELRERIYAKIKPSQFNPEVTLEAHFALQQQTSLSYTFKLECGEDIAILLGMTPHSQRLSSQAQEEILNLNELHLTLDVNLGLFTRL